MELNKDVISHKQSQVFKPSFVDCENGILSKRGKLLVKLWKIVFLSVLSLNNISHRRKLIELTLIITENHYLPHNRGNK